MSSVGMATAMSTPDTASGAHVWPRASTAAIQTTSVVSKIWSPRYERPCAAHSSAMSRLMSGLRDMPARQIVSTISERATPWW